MKIGKYRNMLVKQNISNFADLCLSKKSRELVLNIMLSKRTVEQEQFLQALAQLERGEK